MKNSMPGRGRWASRLGFVLAATGSAIGLGNLWKFPYITFENGGGAFVIIYLISIFIVGIPIMFGELLIGKKTQRNPVGAFTHLRPDRPWWKLIGIFGIFTGFVILSYYSVVAGWTIEYSVKALTGGFRYITVDTAGRTFGEFLASAPKQILWHGVFMAFSILIVIGGISKGIERWSKILMPILCTIIIGLMAYSLTLDGAGDALAFIFTPDFSSITPSAILEALGHAFFTLSLGMGAILTYGSYMGEKEDITRAGLQVALLDTVIALMACMVMYPIIFTYDMEIKESIGIIFTTIPALLVKLPGGPFLAPMFFLLVGFAALTSAISLLEVVVSWGVDELRWNRKKATIFLGIVTFVFGVPSALSNGGVSWMSKKFFPKGVNPETGEFVKLNYLDTWDYLASNWFLPLGGLLIAVFVGWAMKREEKIEEFPTKTHRKIYAFWTFFLKYITPIAVIIVMFYKIGLLNIFLAE